MDGLPPGTANTLIHLSPIDGGLGVPELASYAHYWRARTQLRVLACEKDSQARKAAFDRFASDVAACNRTNTIAPDGLPLLIAEVRDRLIKSPHLAPLAWFINELQDDVSVEIRDGHSLAPHFVLRHDGKVCSTNVLKVLWEHRERLRLRMELANKTLHGSPTLAIPLNDVWNEASGLHIRRPTLFTRKQRSFQIKLQAQSINCESNRVRWGFSESNNCRACRLRPETTAHVTNACTSRLHIYGDRHNAALEVLARSLRESYKSSPSLSVRIDQAPSAEISSSNLRPDIIVELPASTRTGEQARKFVLADLKCPFPTPGFVQATDLRNQAKYEDIRRAHAEQVAPDGTASLHTLILPSVGPIPKATISVLTSLGVRPRSTIKVAKNMVAEIIKNNVKLMQTLHPAWTNTSVAAHE